MQQERPSLLTCHTGKVSQRTQRALMTADPPHERPARPEPFRALRDAQHLPLRAPPTG